ncbi:WD40 repeat-like protein [Suillus decipiens]|nr:WD40 repeat-like protein [Suillus decipiens]
MSVTRPNLHRFLPIPGLLCCWCWMGLSPPHRKQVEDSAISPDGNRIVPCSDDKPTQVWDISYGSEYSTAPLLGHSDSVFSVTFSPNGNRVVSGSEDETIQIWDMMMGKAVGAPLKGHTDSVTSVAIWPDGRRIVSGSYDIIIYYPNVTKTFPIYYDILRYVLLTSDGTGIRVSVITRLEDLKSGTSTIKYQRHVHYHLGALSAVFANLLDESK